MSSYLKKGVWTMRWQILQIKWKHISSWNSYPALLRNLPDPLHFLSQQTLLVLFTVFMNVTCTIQHPSNLMLPILLREYSFSFSFSVLSWLVRLNPCPSLQTRSTSLVCGAGTEGGCLYATALKPLLWLLWLIKKRMQVKWKKKKKEKKNCCIFRY